MEMTETLPGNTTTVSDRVVEAVARVKGEARLSLDPLYESVDPDALDALAEYDGSDFEVRFEYSSCLVRVDAESVDVTATDD